MPIAITSVSPVGLDKLEEGGAQSELLLNANMARLSVGATMFNVADQDQASPPSSPSDEDAYIVAAAGSGDWTGHSYNIAVYASDTETWSFITPLVGSLCYVRDEDLIYRWNGSAWAGTSSPFKYGVKRNVETGLTASTTQTQGNGQLDAEVSIVETVANANDTVTMVVASAGRQVTVINRGANTLQIFPASGDSFDGATADAAITLATSKVLTAWAADSTTWYTLVGDPA